MYSNVDNHWGKNVLIALFFILSFTSSVVFAGAEDLWVYDAAIREKNRIGVGQVAANNGYLNANVYTKVSNNGSSITVTQPIKIAANDAFYKQSGKIAGSVLRGGAAGLALTAATQGMLDAVGWVMDPKNNTITKKPDPDNSNNACGTCSAYQDYYYINNYTNLGNFSSVSAAALNHYKTNGGWETYWSNPKIVSISQRDSNTWDVQYTVYYSYTSSWRTGSAVVRRVSNPNYLAGSGNVPVGAGQVDDAFGDWFAKQPRSITDPVITELYTPFNPVGKGFDGTAGVHFPSVEKTPEIIANMLAHRDAELEAQRKHEQDPENNPAPNNKPEVDNPNKTETEKEPNLNPETETINHPDGSKTEIRKDKKIDPETGEIITTTTTTKTDANGNKSTETSVKRDPAPKSEETKLPDVCDYFSFLCEFVDWMKKDDVKDDDSKELEEITPDIGTLDTSTFKATAGCPTPETFSINGKTIEISYEPICQFARSWSFIAPLIASFSGALIVIGVGRKGEDSDT